MRLFTEILQINKKAFRKIMKYGVESLRDTKFNFKYDPFFILFLFLFLYIPPIFNFNIIIVLSIISVVILVFKYKKLKNLLHLMNKMKLFQYYSAMLLGLIILVMLLPMHEYMIKPVYTIFMITIAVPICSIFVLIYFIRYKYELIDVINILLLVGLMQATISILALFIPPFKTFILNIYLNRGYPIVYQWMEWRIFGLSNELTYSMPVVQSFLAVCALYLTFSESYIYFYYVPILLLSSIINARLGIVISVVGFVMMVIFNFKKEDGKLNLDFIKFIAVILIALIGGFIILFFVSPGIVEWILEMFTDIKELFNGNLTGFFEYMFIVNGFPIPRGTTFFIGVGNTILGGFKGVASDSGFINDLWRGGIFFAIILWGSTAFYLLRPFRKDKSITTFISIFSFLTFLLANFKGLFFSLNEIFTLFSILLPITTYTVLKKEGIKVG